MAGKLHILIAAAMLAAAVRPALGFADEQLAEVTVTARRAELTPRVEKFVTQIAVGENGDGLPRWKARVCPRVIGLRRQEGEFVLGRLSEIAETAGVPLAGEHCVPNLYIAVTPEPRKLLLAMSPRSQQLTYGGVNPSRIAEFIATPRPVRVWYRTTIYDAWGIPLGDTDPILTRWEPLRVPGSVAAHLTFNVTYNFSIVMVVADKAQLQSVSRGQFADYVAMVGLAKIKPGVSLGSAPSILTLFDSAPQSAPAGLSEWDQGFLKALYSTSQSEKMQRSQIAHAIVNDVQH